MNTTKETYWNSKLSPVEGMSKLGKILILSADTYSCFAFRTVLEDLGYFIQFSNSFSQSKSFLRSNRYDFIIIDMVSLRQEGYRLLEHLWDNLQSKMIPVYLVAPHKLGIRESKLMQLYRPLIKISNQRLLLSEIFYRTSMKREDQIELIRK